jgi:hypothetical protein
LGSEGKVRKWEPRLVQKHKYRQSKAESFGKGVAHALDALILAVKISYMSWSKDENWHFSSLKSRQDSEGLHF